MYIAEAVCYLYNNILVVTVFFCREGNKISCCINCKSLCIRNKLYFEWSIVVYIIEELRTVAENVIVINFIIKGLGSRHRIDAFLIIDKRVICFTNYCERTCYSLLKGTSLNYSAYLVYA